MKKYLGIILFAVILALTILFIFLPKNTFSENENRYLKDMPSLSINSLIDGSFTKDLENYVQDHFPFRDFFVNLKATIEICIGKNENNNIYIAKDGYLISKNTYVENSRLDKIVRCFENIISKQTELEFKSSVMLLPTSSTINSNLIPQNATNYSEIERIEYIYSKLNNSANLLLINELQNLNNDVQAYYKTDHHWTSDAAYIAYVKYITSIQDVPLDISNFEKKEVTNSFFGTTYSKANIYLVAPDTITTYTNTDSTLEVKYLKNGKVTEKTDSLYNFEYLDKKDKYAMFLNGNQENIIITNTSMNEDSNNKKLLIIKDSYANCFVPFVVNNFYEVHIIDPKYFAKSVTDYIQEHNINYVLFLYNIDTLVSDQGIFNLK